MRINSKTAGIMVFVILFGGIVLTTALGYWETESTKVPQKFSEGQFAGEYNPEDIRGSYTFADIANSFSIPVEELAYAFGLDKAGIKDASLFKVKDLGSLFPVEGSSEGAVETSSMRLFVALYKGLPYEITEECNMPRPAVEMLFEKGNLTEEQKEYLNSNIIEVPEQNSVPTGEKEETNSESKIESSTNGKGESEGENSEGLVKGNTTFRNLLDWGVPKEVIEETIGGKLPNPVMTIRDFCTQNGLAFSTIKSALQERVDKVK